MDNTFYQQLLEQETALENELSAIGDKLRILREFKKVSSWKKKLPPVFIPNQVVHHSDIKPGNIIYSVDLSIPNKVLAALSTFRQANVQQVANKIVELEPGYPLAKARKDVKHYMSKLSREENSKIRVVTPGAGKRSGIYKYKREEAA